MKNSEAFSPKALLRIQLRHRVNDLIGRLQEVQNANGNRKNEKTIKHYYALKIRLLKCQTLTPKMQSTVDWILDDLKNDNMLEILK